MKGQTWLEVADSAKGTLVTGGRSRRNSGSGGTVHHGNFFQASQTRNKGRGKVEGRRNVMSTMTKYARGIG